jgi:hypothetical protein
VKFILSLLFAGLLPFSTVFAGSATWSMNPSDNDWNTAANWMPPTVPNGSLDTATFEVSSTTDLQISSAVSLDSAVFTPGGSAYQISLNPDVVLNFWGGGAINNSGQTQTFVLLHSGFFDSSTVIFRNSATAGNLVTYESTSVP